MVLHVARSNVNVSTSFFILPFGVSTGSTREQLVTAGMFIGLKEIRVYWKRGFFIRF